MEQENDAAIGGTWVVVPVYNEAAVVGEVLAGLLKRFPNVIAVDDGSTDATPAELSRVPVHVLRHPVNLGQGAAIQTGITYALSRGARWIATFDSDGQMDPGDLARAVLAADRERADVCLGTRFGAGSVIGMPRSRRLALGAGIRLSRLVFGARQTDIHNGLRVFSREAASKLAIRADRMAHATDIALQIERKRLRWVEVPVTIRYTPYSLKKGQRTANAFNILWDLLFG